MSGKYLTLPRTVHLLCVGALINRAGSFLVPFLTIYLQKDLHLGVTFATRVMGVYGIGALVASVLGGHLADRIGRRVVMIISLTGNAAILLVFGSLTSPWSIMVTVLLFSLLAEMYRPAASAMIADVTEPTRRAEAFGLMYVTINLGFAVAASVGGIVSTYSFQWLFWGDALTSALFSLLILLTLRETRPTSTHRIQPAAACSPNEPVAPRQEPALNLAGATKHILADWTFLAYCLGTFFLATAYMQSISTFPIHMANLGFGANTYGLVISLNGLMIVFLQLPTTSIVTRYHRGSMVVLSAVVTAVGFGLIAAASTVGHFALAVAIWTIGEMMGSPLLSAIVSDLAPAHLRGWYMGVFSMSFSSAMLVAAPLGGVVLVTYGATCLWGGCAVVGLAAAVLYASVRNRVVPQPVSCSPPG